MEQYTLIISSFFEIFRLKSSDFARNRVSVRVTFYSKRETNPYLQQIIRAYVNIEGARCRNKTTFKSSEVVNPGRVITCTKSSPPFSNHKTIRSFILFKNLADLSILGDEFNENFRTVPIFPRGEGEVARF